MPPLETDGRLQKAVLWAANDTDRYGELKVDAAIQIDIRWETGQKEAVDPQGNTIAFESTVIVDRVIPVGSILWLGEKNDLPNPPTNLRHVVDYSEIPDVKGRNFRRVVSLMKHSNELPALA